MSKSIKPEIHKSDPKTYEVVKDIENIINTGKVNLLRSVNVEVIKMYWLIGKRIDQEFLTIRSNDYGKHLIKNLSIELSKHGKGFNQANLYRCLKFYRYYPNIFSTAWIKSFLPWSFYRLLIKLDNQMERDWYEKETLNNVWSYRQLERNIKTNYYHRVLSHQIKFKANQPIKINPNDYLKSLFVFDFLKFKKNDKFKESMLEKALLSHLKDLILELGRGYAFIGNQIHLRSDDKDYFIDLVFYNSIMQRNVLIDLKVGKICYKDIGQMLMYLKLFDSQHKQPSDNPSIGLVLSSEIDGDIVRYMSLDNPNHIVPSKYLTYLPTKEELINEIKKSKALLNKEKNYGK